MIGKSVRLVEPRNSSMADVMSVLGKYDLRPEEVEGVSEGGPGKSGYVVAFKDP